MLFINQKSKKKASILIKIIINNLEIFLQGTVKEKEAEIYKHDLL